MALILNNTEESFVLVDRTFSIVIFNARFQKLYREYFGKEVKKNDSILNYGKPERREIVEQIYRRVFMGETLESEIELSFTDNSIHTFYNKFKPAYDEQGNITGAFVTVSDITEKKKSSQQLIANERKFRAMVENGNDAVAILSTEAFPFYVSPSVVGVLGYKEEELMQLDVLTIIHPEDIEAIRHCIETAMSNPGTPVPCPVCRVLHKNGSWRWVEATLTSMLHDPAIGGIVDNFRDVTEKKLAEEKIRIAKERYDIVVKATNEAVWDWDLATNDVQWGDGFRLLFGYDPDTDITNIAAWDAHIHPDDAQKVIDSVTEVAHSAATSQWQAEYRFLKSDGEYAYVLDRGFVMRDGQGKPIRMIGAMQDITRRKKNETAITSLNEELNKRAEELAASNAELESFAYVASHDLQEPLRMVSSFLQLLQKKYKTGLDETATQYISYAVDGAHRMKGLIMDLLEYSRVNTSQESRVKTDISQVVNHVIDTYSSKIKETGAIIKTQLMPTIKANSSQMTQLFQNLVGNALKYNKSAVPEIEIGVEEKQDVWQFFVKDNGIGIDPKFFDRVFVIFQRLHNKNQFSGTGIGLSICKKIVEKHGGKIWIESSSGNGCTFFFTIKK